jgi:sulfotransferase family protein
MTLPNFLIIGAMKSGTTSLYFYLKQHPQAYMSSLKEPNFFALEGSNLNFDGAEGKERIQRWLKRDFLTDIEEYRALFRGAAGETAIGEPSPIYLYSPEASRRIRHYVPEAKLIAVLRSPVERAYSAFLYMTRGGREPLKAFPEALQAEESSMRDNWEWIWHYRHVGLYYTQLKRYYDVFDADQSLPLRGLESPPPSCPAGHLRVSRGGRGVPDTSLRHNVSGTPKSGFLPGLIFRRNPLKTALKLLLPQGLREHISVSLRRQYLVEEPPLAPKSEKSCSEHTEMMSSNSKASSRGIFPGGSNDKKVP